MDFPGVAKNIFAGGPKLEKFRFNHSKLRKQPCFAKTLMGKYQISQSRGRLSFAGEILSRVLHFRLQAITKQSIHEGQDGFHPSRSTTNMEQQGP